MSGSSSGLATATIIETSRLLPWLMITAILSGFAVGLAILAIVLGQISERESRLAQHDAQLLKMELVEHGITIDEHE